MGHNNNLISVHFENSAFEGFSPGFAPDGCTVRGVTLLSRGVTLVSRGVTLVSRGVTLVSRGCNARVPP